MDIENDVKDLFKESEKLDFNIDSFMVKICHLFVEEKSVKKFYYCNLIQEIIQNNSLMTAENILQSDWIVLLRDELFLLYKNRLTHNLRSFIIRITSELTLKCSLDWIRLQGWSEMNSKFFALLLKLICIEINLMFYQKLEKFNNNCIDYLVIFENLLFTLINNYDCEENVNHNTNNGLKLTANEIITCIDNLNETISKIIEFLKFQSMEKQIDETFPIVVGAIRIISLYVLEEKDSELFRNELEEIKPFIKQILNQNEKPEIGQLKEKLKPYLDDNNRNEYLNFILS